MAVAPPWSISVSRPALVALGRTLSPGTARRERCSGFGRLMGSAAFRSRGSRFLFHPEWLHHFIRPPEIDKRADIPDICKPHDYD
jgi:hypothetical protein